MPVPERGQQLQYGRWRLVVVLGILAASAAGFGGLIVVQHSLHPSATQVLLMIAGFGGAAAILFLGPGLLYPLRKRRAAVRKRLPGGAPAWMRFHLYLPPMALAVAFVHASLSPYLAALSVGKVLLACGVFLVVAGWFRHYAIRVQREALLLNVKISQLAAGRSRSLRTLVQDLQLDRRPPIELDVAAASLDVEDPPTWAEVRTLSDRIDRTFPRSGGQRSSIRVAKVFRVIHAPLAILFFVLLAVHVWDVMGGRRALLDRGTKSYPTAADCGSCHRDIFKEWVLSSMARAQSSDVLEAQLPVTLAMNRQVSGLGNAIPHQPDLDGAARSCVSCHAPVAVRFTNLAQALLPLGAEGSGGPGRIAVAGGNAAVQSDGIGCFACHSQAAASSDGSGSAQLPLGHPGVANLGTMYGPQLRHPPPLPVAIHGLSTSPTWADTFSTSAMCGACHDVKIDLNSNGTSPTGVSQSIDEPSGRTDTDGDFQLDQNKPDPSDLVLQTTYDEWQDYAVGFARRFASDDRRPSGPLGCGECHMPLVGNQPLVAYSPGAITPPTRSHRSHEFLGVDYDLDPSHYDAAGHPDAVVRRELAEQKALL